MTGTWIPVAFAVVGLYVLAIIEHWSATGEVSWGSPVSATMTLLRQESLTPHQADRGLFRFAPPLLLVAAMLSFSVLPLGPDATGIPLGTGALFVNAAFAYVLVALVMAGWAPNSGYALIGGFRFLGQTIAYSMLVVMPITAVAMRARSLVNTEIVLSQQSLPNCLAQPLGFVLFVIASMAVSFVPPFDLAIAKGGLAGGVFGEFTGAWLGTLRLARLLLVLSLSLCTTVFFLSGWLGPFLPPALWTLVKTLCVAALMLVAGRFFPRVRSDRLYAWCWKLGIPLALVNILWVGVTLLWVDR